jgi:hypothetical protein
MTTTATDTANKDDAKRFANLIGPMDPKVDREVRELLVTARVGMLLRASFLAIWPPVSNWSTPMSGVPLLPPMAGTFTTTAASSRC